MFSNFPMLKNAVRFCIFPIFCLFLGFFGTASAEPAGKGIVFDGNTAFQVQTNAVPITPRSFSVSVWVRMNEEKESQIFLTSGTPAQDWTLYAYKGRIRFLVQTNEMNGYGHANIPIPEIGKWFHLVGTCDGQNVRLYLNGREADVWKTDIRRSGFTARHIKIGACASDPQRNLSGALEDIRLYSRVLSAAEAAELAEHTEHTELAELAELAEHTELAELTEGPSAEQKNVRPNAEPAVWWSSSRMQDGLPVSLVSPELRLEEAVYGGAGLLLNAKDSGFRSIWYFNQASGDQYGYKYSGGLGTYPANHYPFSVYRPEVNKTFFCYGGTDLTGKTLLHEVSFFDHSTGKLARPVIILDKQTEDAHDNPVMTIDDAGHIWIFSTSHGTGRPSYITRSVRPYDISEFELVKALKMENGKEVPMTNFSYLQVFSVRGEGMFAFFTTYDRSVLNAPESRAARIVSFMKSKDGVLWSEWRPLAAMQHGHYQNAAVWKKDGVFKLGTTFNYHPHNAAEGRVGLNWWTDLYYAESLDGGKTWQTIDGKPLETPMLTEKCPALVHDYESEKKNVYIMDLVYDANGWPIIFYITSSGWRSGPDAGPREWFTCAWNGEKWEIRKLTESDNNYDFGSLYVEKDGTWRVVATDGSGPQEFNTGGEVSLWSSSDRGASWQKIRQMTKNSPRNHCYPRRPIDWHEDFFAFWADGHGRSPSEADLYFSNIRGEVFKLPRTFPDGEELTDPIPLQ